MFRFREANLHTVWEQRKHDLDNQNINWEDVLSLGEQQRLQFCRLFWHFDWHLQPPQPRPFGQQ